MYVRHILSKLQLFLQYKRSICLILFICCKREEIARSFHSRLSVMSNNSGVIH